MKKFWKYIAIAAMTAVVVPFTSCDDDDELGPKSNANYEANFAYLYQPTSTYAQVEYKANGDFLSGLTDPLKLVPIRLTKPAPGNITVEVAIDAALVDEYNQANGTSYKFLEGASIVNPFMTINAGEYITTDSITVSFGDHSGFINQESDLMLPIVVRGGNGLTPSKSGRVFLTFNSSYRPNLLTTPSESVTFKAGIKNPGWEETVRTLNVENAIALSYNPFEEVTINIAIDQSKVADYNAANGTNYEFKSDAELVESTLTIGTDNNTASFVINTGDLTGIANEGEYLIPVTITSAEGASIEFDETSDNTIYVVVKGVGREISVSTTEYSGTLLAKPISCTVDGNDTYIGGWSNYPWIDIIDNDSWAYGYLFPDSPMVIDFGKEVNLTSIYVYHYGSYYSATGATLETSTNGTNWLDWGETSYEKSDKYYINLSAAATARYVRIVFTGGGYSSSGIEIDGMQFYGE